jgi:endonuclease YncB( thermonuclease family)
MGNVIDSMRSGPLKGLTFGVVGLGLYRDGTGTAKSQVSDGDTISSHPQVSDDLGVRFLGVDAPEKSFPLPKETAFKALDHKDWQEFLKDALDESKYGKFDPPMTSALAAHLKTKLGPNAATNHREHALAAKTALVDLVEKDMAALGQTKETFRFFLAFAYDVMDGFGRLLCYINRQQTDDDDNASPRPDFYQERLLETGHVAPFFIWPNVDPFITEQLQSASLLKAVPAPKTAADIEKKAPRLKKARAAVQAARAGHKGIFAAGKELALLASEVRFLSSRHPNRRWVIDLSKRDDTLIPPQDYFTVPNYEDRLYIPEEFVPLFVDQGWKK